MHLVYLDPHPVPNSSTESLQILYTADAMGEQGIRVTLVTPEPHTSSSVHDILGHELSKNVKLCHLPSAVKSRRLLSSNKPFYHRAIQLLRELGADVAYARNLKMAERILRQIRIIPLVFETHEPFTLTFREDHPNPSWLERHKLTMLRRREEFVYRNALGLVAVPPYLIEELRREFGIRTPAVIAPNGVDLRQAEAPHAHSPNPVPILLYLGSLHPWKGIETLIQAMRFVTPPARLHIVGGGEDRIAQLRNLAETEGVADRVTLVGPVTPDRRFEVIHRADICLLPLTKTGIGSRHTSPIKLFEYMAAGKAIVVSDLPSTRAVVEPGRHVIMAEVDNPLSFAEAINTLLTDPALRDALGRNARNHVGQFSWRKRAETILSGINDWMHHRGAAKHLRGRNGID